jgi:hypothetical protein
MTPEGEVITAAFLVFEDVPDILTGQLIQESLTELRVKFVPATPLSRAVEELLKSRVQMLVGTAMKITMEQCESLELFRGESGKVQSVVSKLKCFPP